MVNTELSSQEIIEYYLWLQKQPEWKSKLINLNGGTEFNT